MRSNYFFILFATLLFTNERRKFIYTIKKYYIDKNKEISIFENEVLVRTEENNEIIMIMLNTIKTKFHQI